MALTVGITALVEFAQGPSTAPDAVTVVPSITLLPASPRSEQLVLGPGFVGTF